MFSKHPYCILLFKAMFGLNSHRILLLLKPRKESGTRFWKNMLTTWHGLIHEISTWTWQDRWFLYMLEALWLRSLVISRFGWGFKQFLWNVQPVLEGRQSGNHLHVYVDIVFFFNAPFFRWSRPERWRQFTPTKKTGRCDSGIGRSYNKPSVVGVDVSHVFPPLVVFQVNSSTTVTFASLSTAESKMVSLALLVFLGAAKVGLGRGAWLVVGRVAFYLIKVGQRLWNGLQYNEMMQTDERFTIRKPLYLRM